MDRSHVERHSYNNGDFRRNNSERSDRSDFKKNQANSYLQSKNKQTTVNSGAKAKIKQMLGRDHSNLNISSENQKMDSFSSNKRKTSGQKIFEGVLEYNPKKLHKKSNSLKADVMNKYFIKGGRAGSNDGHHDIINRSADDGHHVSGRHVSSSQQDKRNLSSGDQETFGQFGQGNAPHPSGGSGGVKVNSFLGSKNPPGLSMLNNCEPRKNLNDKIMNKYKKTSLLGGSKLGQPGANNFNDLSMSKSEYNKPLYAEPVNTSYNGGTGVYEKFIANTKKKSLMGSNSLTSKDNNYIPGVTKAERGSSGYGMSNNEQVGSAYKNNSFYNNSYSKNKAPLAGHHRKTESLNYKYATSKKPAEDAGPSNLYGNSGLTGSSNSFPSKKLGYKGVTGERKQQKTRSGTNSVSYSATRKSAGQQSQGHGMGPNTGNDQSPDKNISTKKKPSFDIIEEIKARDRELPHFEKSKVIIKDFGAVKAFSVNTHQGTVRSYNEDRVSI
jgi:hypothetical protein